MKSEENVIELDVIVEDDTQPNITRQDSVHPNDSVILEKWIYYRIIICLLLSSIFLIVMLMWSAESIINTMECNPCPIVLRVLRG